jgi:CubicO group peptidase (beta-lactamase class C family)
MSQVQGHCGATFGEVQKLLENYLESGEELGASIAVNINGQNVVDIWGGFSDPDRTHPWEEDTIVNVYSTTKTITSLAVLMLVDRGLLDINAKVTKYWPEFAKNGKQDIEVRHFLSHSAGVSGWEAPITLEDTYDVEQSTARLAKQAPWWTPGTAPGYHSMTFGHLNGELIRRTTGKSLKLFVAEEIAGPLGADFQIGALERDWPRVATIILQCRCSIWNQARLQRRLLEARQSLRMLPTLRVGGGQILVPATVMAMLVP